MHSLKLEFALTRFNAKMCLVVTILEADYDVLDITALFSEVAESIIFSSYDCFEFDLSALVLVNSTVFGACINIANAAKDKQKRVRFKFNADAMEIVTAMSLHQFLDIVPVAA